MDHGVGKTVFVRLDEVVISRDEYEALKAAAVKYAALVDDETPPAPPAEME